MFVFFRFCVVGGGGSSNYGLKGKPTIGKYITNMIRENTNSLQPVLSDLPRQA